MFQLSHDEFLVMEGVYILERQGFRVQAARWGIVIKKNDLQFQAERYSHVQCETIRRRFWESRGSQFLTARIFAKTIQF
jgi:hypothetical protein